MTRTEHPRGGGCIQLIINDEHVARILAAKRQVFRFMDEGEKRRG